MKIFKSKLVLLFPVFTLILAFMLSGCPSSAVEKYEITLKLKNESVLGDGEKNIDFEIWQLNDRSDFEMKDVLEEMKPLSRERLNEKYGEPVKTVSVKENTDLKITGLEKGIYYLRDKNHKKKKFYYTPVAFRLPHYNQTEFNLKLVSTSPTIKPGGGEDEPEVNGVRFIKVADDKEKSPLKGAVFKVTYRVNNQYKTVQKNGKDYIVTSGNDGSFTVEDLEYGEYFLWEIKAPKGYKALQNGIKFTIDENSNTGVNAIEIENKKKKEKTPGQEIDNPEEVEKNPPAPTTNTEINIPKTGDVMLILLIIEGAVLTALGYYMVRSEKS